MTAYRINGRSYVPNEALAAALVNLFFDAFETRVSFQTEDGHGPILCLWDVADEAIPDIASTFASAAVSYASD